MALNLLDSFGKKGVNYGLATKQADVIDPEFRSKYFVVSDFAPNFTPGKNSFSFNGSKYLLDPSQVFLECLDSKGTPLYTEMATYADVSAQTYAYKEGTAWVLSIHVYNDTANGIGKITLYGTLGNGKTVKWQQNITINKAAKNISTVRFYQTPTLEASSVLVPVLATPVGSSSIITKNLVGYLHGLAVNPKKDTNFPTVNKQNVDIDYRMTIDSPQTSQTTGDINAINSQMKGGTVNLILNKIQPPFSTTDIVPLQRTGTFVIGDVLTNNTFQTTMPYYYQPSRGNFSVTNITNASYSISYPFVTYNNSASTYLTTSIGGQSFIVVQSYADITYRNIRTFSGYVARHKVYRKSLVSSADFSIVADEPVAVNEILRDNNTQNKFYDRLGVFYNDDHIARYWFTSSNNLTMTHTPDVAINSMLLGSSTPEILAGNDYIMVKNDSVRTNRDAIYVPFDQIQFNDTSGSAYDSNFMFFRANVQYILELDAIILKDPNQTQAGLEFYVTSSGASAKSDKLFTNRYGLRVATLTSTQTGVSSQNLNNQVFFFTPNEDVYGTMVIVPYRCQAYLKNISFRVYGDDGFSPDTFTTRIPWPVNTANESFEIKSELFDVNQTLVYSDLRVLASFDPSGSSLIPFIPGGGTAGDLFVMGNLTVSKSIDVQKGNIVIEQGNIFVPNIGIRPGAPQVSASRFLSVRHDNAGEIVENPVVDITADDTYLYLDLGPLPGVNPPAANPITTFTSLASIYADDSGRRIFYVGGVKFVESGSMS